MSFLCFREMASGIDAICGDLAGSGGFIAGFRFLCRLWLQISGFEHFDHCGDAEDRHHSFEVIAQGRQFDLGPDIFDAL